MKLIVQIAKIDHYKIYQIYTMYGVAIINPIIP